MEQLLGIDVGGTFTDLLWIDGEGNTRAHKVLNTGDPSNSAVPTAVELVSAPEEVQTIVHGTTVATNTIIERNGARTLLLTTRGFRDVLELQKQERRDIWNFRWARPEALVRRTDRLEVDERIDANGVVLQKIDAAAEVDRLASEVELAEFDSVAIGFINSYRNGSNERALAEELRSRFPHLYIAVSSELVPQFREYDRISTTVISAYLGPVVRNHVARIKTELRECGFVPSPLIMQSNGTVIPAEVSERQAAAMCMSGPSGGVLASMAVARRSGVENVICLDMGGTSTDVSLIENGKAQLRFDAEIDGLPNLMPSFKIETVGAGGGSVISVDEAGHLHCGPRSAGARPGPAAYGNGGTQLTVTDAWVILGVLRPSRSESSELRIHPDLAYEAAYPLAEHIGVPAEELARQALRIATANMSRALRLVSVEQGHDPRAFALISYGGAGGLHAALCADELGIETVIVPASPGVFSAYGLVCADIARSYVRSFLVPLDEAASYLAQAGRELGEQASGDLLEMGTEGTQTLQFSAELRYEGQAHEVSVDIELSQAPEEIAANFHRLHEKRYGFSEPESGIELVNVRLLASVACEVPELVSDDVHEQLEERLTVPWHPQREVSFLARASLVVGTRYPGPIVIEEKTSTIVVPEGWNAERDERGQLWLRK